MQLYRRWSELATDVGAPTRTQLTVVVCRALADDLRAALAVVLESGPNGTALRPLVARSPVDLGFYVGHLVDAPVLRHFRAQPQDQQVRSSLEVDGCAGDPATAVVVARLRADRLDHTLAFPVPAMGVRGPQWLVVARAEPFDGRELALAREVHPLLVGLERYAAGHDAVDGRDAADGHDAADGVPGQRHGGEAVPAAAARPRRLTDRERAVLLLMSEGLIAQAIGRRLGVSPRTVTKHQERIYRKLETTDRLTAVLRAQAEGLVGPDGRQPVTTALTAASP